MLEKNQTSENMLALNPFLCENVTITHGAPFRACTHQVFYGA